MMQNFVAFVALVALSGPLMGSGKVPRNHAHDCPELDEKTIVEKWKGVDDDIVSELIKRTAEKETNPDHRRMLWSEYDCYLESSVAKHKRTRPYEATYCVAVAAYDTHTDDLVGRFDNFANSLKLEIDGSHPSSRIYSSSARDYEIVVSTHLGEFGSVVSLYHIGDVDISEVQLQLRSFLTREVQPNYGVTLCSEIEGFRNPTIYR